MPVLAEEYIYLGYSRFVYENYLFFRCPTCQKNSNDIAYDENNIVRCFYCKKENYLKKFKKYLLKTKCAICKNCGELTPIINDFKFSLTNQIFYGCRKCENILISEYNNELYHPDILLNIHWNANVFIKNKKIADNLYFKPIQTNKDIMILLLFQYIAKKEDSRFRYFKSKLQKAAFIFNNNYYIGYITWVEEKKMILQQIYIISRYRKLGYAQNVVSYWINNKALKYNSNFEIESPNDSIINLINKFNKETIEKCIFSWGI